MKLCVYLEELLNLENLLFVAYLIANEIAEKCLKKVGNLRCQSSAPSRFSYNKHAQIIHVNKTPAKHRDIFRCKKCNAPARVRKHDLVPGRQTHYQLCHGD